MSEAKFSAVKIKTSSQQINLVQKDVYQDSASVQLLKENPNFTSMNTHLLVSNINVFLVQKNSSINEPKITSNDSQKEIVDNKTNNLSKLKK